MKRAHEMWNEIIFRCYRKSIRSLTCTQRAASVIWAKELCIKKVIVEKLENDVLKGYRKLLHRQKVRCQKLRNKMKRMKVVATGTYTQTHEETLIFKKTESITIRTHFQEFNNPRNVYADDIISTENEQRTIANRSNAP